MRMCSVSAKRYFIVPIIAFAFFAGYFYPTPWHQPVAINPVLFEGTNPENAPLIFIGGAPGSGTSMMNSIINAHPAVRCSGESRLIFDILKHRFDIHWTIRHYALKAHDVATAMYILHAIKAMGSDAPLLCHKRPRSLYYMDYLHYLFPKARFIVMLRDGRASMTSRIRRSETGKMGQSAIKHRMDEWIDFNLHILPTCQRLGPKVCMVMRYEHVVLNSEPHLRQISDFLGVPYDSAMLTPYVYKSVQQSIITSALSRWSNPNQSGIPFEIINTLHEEYPLLDVLGFTQLGIPPDYSKLRAQIPDFRYLDLPSLQQSVQIKKMKTRRAHL